MRVLVVVPQPPAAQGGAADRCTIGLVRGLVDNGVDVSVLAAHFPFTPAYARAELPALVEVVDVTPAAGWWARAEELARPLRALAGGAFGARLRELAAGVDVVHLEQVETAGAYTGPVPTVAHLHYRAALDRPFGPPWRRQFREVLSFTRAERYAARHQRWLIANSTRVASTLRRVAPEAETTVVPLTLDASSYVVRALAPDAAPTAGLIGDGRWAPTAAAMRRLTDRVWPLVDVPGTPRAQLRIAGRGTGSPRADGSVEWVGEVDDASAFLGGLHVLVYPIDRGSGMKVKTLEALALGVPVVTTPAGAEGVPASDGVLVADDDRELAAHASRLLRDPSERRERATAARRTFDDQLSPVRAGALLRDLYERMVR